MDRRFLFPNFSESDFKLTRAASFSELSTTKKVIIEQHFQSKTGGNLVKQYSCEQIFDKKSNTSQVKVSQVIKSDNEQHENIWKTKIPSYIPLKDSGWPKDSDMLSNKQIEHSFPNQYPAITGPEPVNSKKIIAPPKFIIEQSDPKLGNVVDKNNLQSYNQMPTSNQKDNDSIFSLNNILPAKMLDKKDYVSDKNKGRNDLNIDKHEPYDLNKKNTFEFENKQTLATSELKKNLRSLVAIKPKRRTKLCAFWTVMFLILLPIAITFTAMFINGMDFSKGFCNPQFKIDKISQELKKHIYGQQTAVNILSEYFRENDRQIDCDILAFIGGIGVGKSYTSDIIKNAVKDSSKILDVYPPLYKKEDQTYTSLSVCRCNLIRLENLKTEDIADAARFISVIKQKATNYCILILALFNVQETDHNLKRTMDLDKSMDLIREKFKDVNLTPTFVQFNAINDETLTKCIKDAANYNNVELSDDDIEYVRRDLLAADSGCKGAYAKVQLFGKTVKHLKTDL